MCALNVVQCAACSFGLDRLFAVNVKDEGGRRMRESHFNHFLHALNLYKSLTAFNVHTRMHCVRVCEQTTTRWLVGSKTRQTSTSESGCVICVLIDQPSFDLPLAHSYASCLVNKHIKYAFRITHSHTMKINAAIISIACMCVCTAVELKIATLLLSDVRAWCDMIRIHI